MKENQVRTFIPLQLVHLLKKAFFLPFWRSQVFLSYPWKLSCLDTLLCSFFTSPKQAGSNFAFVFTHIIHPVTVRHCSKSLFSDPYKLFQVKVHLQLIWDLPCSSMLVNISLVWMSIRVLLLIFIWHFYISEVIYCILNNLFFCMYVQSLQLG